MLNLFVLKNQYNTDQEVNHNTSATDSVQGSDKTHSLPILPSLILDTGPLQFSDAYSLSADSENKKKLFVTKLNNSLFNAFKIDLININNINQAFVVDKENICHLCLDIKIEKKEELIHIFNTAIYDNEFNFKDLIIEQEKKIIIKINQKLLEILNLGFKKIKRTVEKIYHPTLFNKLPEDLEPLILCYCSAESNPLPSILGEFNKYTSEELEIIFYDLIMELPGNYYYSENLLLELKKLIKNKDIFNLEKISKSIKLLFTWHSKQKTLEAGMFNSIQEILSDYDSFLMKGESLLEKLEKNGNNMPLFLLFEEIGISINKDPRQAAEIYEKICLRIHNCPSHFFRLIIDKYIMAAENEDKKALTRLENLGYAWGYQIVIQQKLKEIYSKNKLTLSLAIECSEMALKKFKKNPLMADAEYVCQPIGEMSASENLQFILQMIETKHQEALSSKSNTKIKSIQWFLEIYYSKNLPIQIKAYIKNILKEVIKSASFTELFPLFDDADNGDLKKFILMLLTPLINGNEDGGFSLQEKAPFMRCSSAHKTAEIIFNRPHNIVGYDENLEKIVRRSTEYIISFPKNWDKIRKIIC